MSIREERAQVVKEVLENMSSIDEDIEAMNGFLNQMGIVFSVGELPGRTMILKVLEIDDMLSQEAFDEEVVEEYRGSGFYTIAGEIIGVYYGDNYPATFDAFYFSVDFGERTRNQDVWNLVPLLDEPGWCRDLDKKFPTRALFKIF